MLSKKLEACVIIPARYSSSRFPGKPLVPLLGKPMILWVAELSAIAVGREHVYVATEDIRISEVVRQAGFSSIITSSNALTGTDRLAEAACTLEYDTFINVQGDEPLVEPADVVTCIEMKSMLPNAIINGYCWIGEGEYPQNSNIPKIITNEDGRLIYASRALIPAHKEPENVPKRYKKQVCIYGFSKEELRAFSAFGRKSEIEQFEDIEILRFFELGYPIQMYECEVGSLAVDIPSDIFRVEQALTKKRNRKSSQEERGL